MKNAILDVHTLASYLHFKKPDITPIKLHKSLYFLLAYFGALYDELLFEAQIEAWDYGPVVREVFMKQNTGIYALPKKITKSFLSISENPKIQKFLDDMIEQITSVSDFSLVERSKNDETWKKAHKINRAEIINQEQLFFEYKERYINMDQTHSN